jgi:hypothetical protein
MDGHATRNMLKQRQDFDDGRLSTTLIGPSFPSSIEVDCLSPTLRLAIPPSSNIGPLEKPMTKREMLQFQSKNFATMAFRFQVSLEIHDALLAMKMDINHECKTQGEDFNLENNLGVRSNFKGG